MDDIYTVCTADTVATCGADLVEVPVEAILIVGNGGDEGKHEAPAAPHLTVPGAVLGVLPQGAIVLLMHAHCLLDDHGLTCTLTSPCYKVLHDTEKKTCLSEVFPTCMYFCSKTGRPGKTTVQACCHFFEWSDKRLEPYRKILLSGIKDSLDCHLLADID